VRPETPQHDAEIGHGWSARGRSCVEHGMGPLVGCV
jgi:hypothetical protein